MHRRIDEVEPFMELNGEIVDALSTYTMSTMVRSAAILAIRLYAGQNLYCPAKAATMCRKGRVRGV